MNIKKHILKNNNQTELFALGVTSSETEFQLSLHLNSFLPNKLSIAPPIIIKDKQDSISFPCFKYDDEDILQITLIKNKNKNSVLFQNNSTSDFIIILSGAKAPIMLKDIPLFLKNQNNITLVAQLDVKKLKNLKKYTL